MCESQIGARRETVWTVFGIKMMKFVIILRALPLLIIVFKFDTPVFSILRTGSVDNWRRLKVRLLKIFKF